MSIIRFFLFFNYYFFLWKWWSLTKESLLFKPIINVNEVWLVWKRLLHYDSILFLLILNIFEAIILEFHLKKGISHRFLGLIWFIIHWFRVWQKLLRRNFWNRLLLVGDEISLLLWFLIAVKGTHWKTKVKNFHINIFFLTVCEFS